MRKDNEPCPSSPILLSRLSADELRVSLEEHARWCASHIFTLYCMLWVLAVLNAVLLGVLCWLEITR